MRKSLGDFFLKKVPARNEKESKGMIQGIFKECLGHVLDKSWTHPRCLRDAFGMPSGRLRDGYRKNMAQRQRKK